MAENGSRRWLPGVSGPPSAARRGEAEDSPGPLGQVGPEEPLPRQARGSRGPTKELKRAAEELAARVVRGDSVTPDDLQRIRSLLALDLIQSSRPTARVKGYKMLEGLYGAPDARCSEEDAVRALGLL